MADDEGPEEEGTPEGPPSLGQQVADFLGHGDDPALLAQAEEAVELITAVAHAYTRGRGFTPADDDSGELVPAPDIVAVVKISAARLVMNPSQAVQESYDGYTVTNGVWRGFTLGERHVLDRYRVRWA